VLMGTGVNLTVLGDDPEQARAAAEATLNRMAELESLLSRYREDSQVGVLNATGRVDGASEALLDVLRLADRIAELGEGAFDVTVQPVLDVYRGALAETGGLPTDSEIEAAMTRVGKRGIRIGSAVDGFVTAFIPDPEPDPDNAGTTAAEGVAVDAAGNIYGAEVGPRQVVRYERR